MVSRAPAGHETRGTHAVLVIDMFHYDEESEVVVEGFPTLEAAREYARRRTRDSVEGLREPGQSHEELRQMWSAFGEDAIVLGREFSRSYAGFSELDYFIANPASPEESDWVGLGRELGVTVKRE